MRIFLPIASLDRDSSILSTDNSMDFAQYTSQIIELVLLNTIHRLFNGYYSILSTEYLKDIA
jgi:hypothetical protein